MASIASYSGGRRRIQWIDGDRRPTLWLRGSLRAAETVRTRIEALQVAKVTGQLDLVTAQWLMDIDDGLHARLMKFSLTGPRVKGDATVGALLEKFFETLSVKAGTRITYLQTRTSLEKSAAIGKDHPLGAVGDEQARRWRKEMVDAGLAQATISKRVKTARQIFSMGVRWRLLRENPFAAVRAGTQANPKRGAFVERWVIDKTLAHCPPGDDGREWKAIIGLARYGGLRCPSEILTLRLVDLDWDQGRMKVWSSKTEGNEGGEFRIVPMFPELRRILLEVYEWAVDGQVHVIERTRSDQVNWRTRLLHILAKAGVNPWPRLFQNLRASRQTELEDSFPGHVVCAWMGNSAVVARQHYLQVLDRHFEAALASEGVAQKVAHPGGAPSVTEKTRGHESPSSVASVQSDSTQCHSVHNEEVTPMGFEPMSRP